MGLYTEGGGGEWLIFGREGTYSQRFAVYVKRGPDSPTKKPAGGQCPRPFLSLPCEISLNQAMRLSVVFFYLSIERRIRPQNLEITPI